jgi:hypothetical protein
VLQLSLALCSLLYAQADVFNYDYDEEKKVEEGRPKVF